MYASQSGKTRSASPEEEEEEDEPEVVVSDSEEEAEDDLSASSKRDEAIIIDDVEMAGFIDSPDLSQDATARSSRRSLPSRSSASQAPQQEQSSSDPDRVLPADIDMSDREDDGLSSSAPVTIEAIAEQPIAGPSRRRRSSTPEVIALDDLGDQQPGLISDPSASTRLAYREEISSTAVNSEMTMSFDLEKLRERHRKRRRLRHAPTPHSKDAYSIPNEGGLSSAAGIGNRDITSAGEALSRVISKADFEHMEVLGQFNKGFIVARLRHPQRDGRGATDDLFIVDQHASDEKFNFETLQRTTQIKAQSLIR